jgi:hypothetical protein
MRTVLKNAIKTALMLGLGLSVTSLIADPAMAGYYYKFSKSTETIHFPTFNPGSEGNFPSICDGQVGYWEQIPMPGGKVFCVLHFTEFFKGGVGSGSSQECVGVVTKYKQQQGPDPVVWTKVVFTKPGSCSTHSMPH